MKKIATIFALSFCVLCFCIAGKVQAVSNLGGFVIDDFQVGIDIKDDGSFVVEENIVVDFFEQRHGIFREIPFKYKGPYGTNFRLRMDDFEVRDEKGNFWNVAQKYKEDGNIVLKIGDQDVFVSGKQFYKISYRVSNGMRFFEDHSELYWNPIGTGWPTEIGEARAIVNLHKSIVFSENDLACFTGHFGSQERNCSIAIASSDKVRFSANSSLQPYEGMTIATRFPLSFVPKPEVKQLFLYFLADNWGFALPVLALFVMFSLWVAHGKEPDQEKTIIVQYGPPEKLTPGELGYLLKERYSTSFVSADIINLAVKGYLRIRELEEDKNTAKLKKIGSITGLMVPILIGGFILSTFAFSAFGESLMNPGSIIFSIAFLSFFILFFSVVVKNAKKGKTPVATSDYELESTKDWRGDSNLTEHEKELLKGLFGLDAKGKIKLSEKKGFHKNVKKAIEKVEAQINLRGYFEKGKLNKKAMYVFIGAAIIFLGIISGSGLQRIDLLLGPIISGVIVIIFGVFMSKKTQQGMEALRLSNGLRQYIHTAERYRIEFQEKENIFEKVLPYAMVFGMADKWAQAFEGIYDHNPPWYSSSSPRPFQPAVFANSLSSGFSSAATSAAASPSSSSSGFSGGSSGGGGGGGGGGSW